MGISDGLIILATLAGPILAVQAQKWVERAKEERNKKIHLFHVLMATRGLRASSTDHVQALNLIDLYFREESKSSKDVREAWHTYLDFLNTDVKSDWTAEQNIAHNVKAEDHLADLLKLMGKALGYSFEKVEVKRGIYLPRGHIDENVARATIRDGWVKILTGQQSLSMAVKEFPASEEALAKQLKIQDAMLATLSGEKPLRIETNT